jgi:hypothetical protein
MRAERCGVPNNPQPSPPGAHAGKFTVEHAIV